LKNIKRERQRYLYFKILKNEDISFSERDFLHVLWKNIWRYFGLKAGIKIGLWLIELNFDESYGIIRCTNDTKEIMISVLTLLTEINNIPLILTPVKTYGTLKAIKNDMN
jgi:RNase P/RNase MRP subunit POP5